MSRGGHTERIKALFSQCDVLFKNIPGTLTPIYSFKSSLARVFRLPDITASLLTLVILCPTLIYPMSIISWATHIVLATRALGHKSDRLQGNSPSQMPLPRCRLRMHKRATHSRILVALTVLTTGKSAMLSSSSLCPQQLQTATKGVIRIHQELRSRVLLLY